MNKIDFKKDLDCYQAKRNIFRILTVPKMQYLMIDGHGDPNTSQEFSSAVESLFPVAYKLKFMSKKELDKDYVVTPLEALWWAEDMDMFTATRDKSSWDWTMMLYVPDWITPAMFKEAVEQVKQKSAPLSLDKIRFVALEEGLCVQTLHIGSYDDETPVLDELHHEFMPENYLTFNGKHHEIYLSDFRKVAPDKLKTILRQPVKKID